jgi:hypothetical protein
MNTKYISDPEEFAGFFMSSNRIVHSDMACIICITSPRYIIKFKASDSFFTSFHEFHASISTISWLDGIAASQELENSLLIKAYNFLTIHETIIEDELYQHAYSPAKDNAGMVSSH